MTAADWRIDVRDKDRRRVGQLDVFQRLEMVLKFNDVSTWRITLDRRNRLAPDLLADGAGILVYRGDTLMLSGYWTDQEHEVSKDASQVAVSGVDDTGWLVRRLAYPDPNDITPPYATQAGDIRTGLASTVLQQFVDENGGLNTPVARRIPGLFAGSGVDPLIGPTVTATGRWQKLLPLLQEIATSSEAQGTTIGFYIVQSGTDLLLVIYGPDDKTDTVVFSPELGNLAGFVYKRGAPTRTYAIVGGDGEGTARTIYEKPNSALVASWGRIEDDLADSRNGNSALELSQAADAALTDGGGTSALSITPKDLAGQKFGVHYNLGDKVTVLLDSVGTPVEMVVADAVGQGTSATADYLIALQADALPFVAGTRVQVNTSAGLLKEPGVRKVVSTATAFGFTNIYFDPPAAASTVSGDHLVSIVPSPTTGDPIVDRIREVNITLTPDDGELIVPAVGTGISKVNPNKVFAFVGTALKRIRNLERR